MLKCFCLWITFLIGPCLQADELRKARVPVDGYEVMTYSYGEGDNVLLLISGGPGFPCNFNQFRDCHQVYAQHGFRVVTWDQLGCGESDIPSDDSLWTLKRFVTETEAVRAALHLGKVHLLGHSWGGVVGFEYCFAYPEWVRSFTLAACAASIPEIQRGCDAMKLQLGSDALVLRKHEEAGTTGSTEYQSIVQKFLNEHTCRLSIWPKAFGPSATNINLRVCEQISGLQFLKWTGPLKNWNRLPDLHQLTLPVLIIQGEYDWVTPEISRMALERLPNAELKILKNCSHIPYYEDPSAYQSALLPFLKAHSIQD